MATEEQFWSYMIIKGPDECWEWQRAHSAEGYGSVRFEGRHWPAHALADYLTNGPAPKGTHRHHICKNPPCCNPAHLLRVTPLEHMREHSAEITHCPKGHPYEGDNLYVSPSGHRFCIACRRMKDKQRRPDRGLRGTADHCKYGHPKSGDNLYVDPKTGQRKCRKCQRAYAHAANPAP